jgi:hypothetical protein
MAWTPPKAARNCQVADELQPSTMSPVGTSRHFAVARHFGRFRNEADMDFGRSQTGFMGTFNG